MRAWGHRVILLILLAALSQGVVNTLLATPAAQTSTPIATSTATATATSTDTATATATSTDTATATATSTDTPTSTATFTPTAAPTLTATAAPTATSTPLTPTATSTPLTPTATSTPLTPTATSTPLTPTVTSTPITVTVTPTVTPTATPTALPVDFDRRLEGDRVGQHKAPPTSPITITVSARPRVAVVSATLSDYFPVWWEVVDAGGGVVAPANGITDTNRISWVVGDLGARQWVERTYVLRSPKLTTPPTEYNFYSELAYTGGSTRSDDWRVIVADPFRINQTDFRIGNDDGGFSTMTWRAGCNTSATVTDTATAFRVRFEVTEVGGTTGTWTPQLDWSTATGGPWQAVGTTVVAGKPFVVADTTYYINAADIPTGNFACPPGTGTAQTGKAIDTTNPLTGTISLTASYYTNIEYNVKATTSALDGQTYYFRLSNSGTAFYSYTNYASVLAAPAAAKLRESDFRLGSDASFPTTTWLANCNTTATVTTANFRVRFVVYNDGTVTRTWTPRLDWSTSTSGPWLAVGTSALWGLPFQVAPSTYYINAADIPTGNFQCTLGPGTATMGKAMDTTNPLTGTLNLLNGYYTNIEYNVAATTDADHGGTYYFRLSNNGTTFDAFANYASVTRQGTSDPHRGYIALEDACASCHRAHTGRQRELRSALAEETVCFNCHGNPPLGANTNIEAGFLSTYKHPVTNTTGVHKLGEKDLGPNWNTSGSARHAECEDCHNPHSNRPPGHMPGVNTASGVITGTWGVQATYGVVSWTVPTFTPISNVTKEYELCFKCHSSYGYGSTPPNAPSAVGWVFNSLTLTDTKQTDQSVEFNPNNYSHHAVFQAGGNQPPVTANANWPNNGLGLSNNFRTDRGWYATSTVQCSDCHGRDATADPQGPHGSNNRFMLRNNETETAATDPAIFCYNCHKYDVYRDGATNDNWSRYTHATGSGTHADGSKNRWGIWCLNCHGGDGMFWNAQGDRGGGLHGSKRGLGLVGTSPVGKRMMNGAGMGGYTASTTTCTNGIEGFTKSTSDAISTCTSHDTGQNTNCNYLYY